jgi:transposase
MKEDQREIRRKLRVLEHAERSGDVSKTCRYFGIGRASFCRWRDRYRREGEAGLTNKRSVAHNHPNKTPAAVVEKVLQPADPQPGVDHGLGVRAQATVTPTRVPLPPEKLQAAA